MVTGSIPNQNELFIRIEILQVLVKSNSIFTRLNMDSGQFAWLRHQQLQKGFEQAFTPDPDVVHALKEAQVERQFFL